MKSKKKNSYNFIKSSINKLYKIYEQKDKGNILGALASEVIKMERDSILKRNQSIKILGYLISNPTEEQFLFFIKEQKWQ